MGLEQLEARVELPEFAPALVRQLDAAQRAVCGASCRKLALRALGRLEPPTLAMHGVALLASIEQLEDFEREAEHTVRLLRLLRGAAAMAVLSSSSEEWRAFLHRKNGKRPRPSEQAPEDLRHKLVRRRISVSPSPCPIFPVHIVDRLIGHVDLAY